MLLSLITDYSDKYIVVPIEDVIGVEEALNAFKREHNGTDSTTSSDGYKEVCNKFPEVSLMTFMVLLLLTSTNLSSKMSRNGIGRDYVPLFSVCLLLFHLHQSVLI